MLYDIHTQMIASGVGSNPALSESFTELLRVNPSLNMLLSGLISSVIAVVMTLLPKKGMILMSVLITTLSLVACGELVYVG
jgi:hypothetical protein